MMKFLSDIYHWLFPIEIKGNNNEVVIECKYKNFSCKVFGNYNRVRIDKSCLLQNTSLTIIGDNCEVVISPRARLLGPCTIFICESGKLFIGENAGIRGVNFEVGGGKKISIGSLCMFSYGITIRNYDSHKVIDIKSNSQTNMAKDICLGNHVWICKNVSILKGVTVGDDSILGYGCIVTEDVPVNSIVAGVPARVVKKNITWDY